MSPKLKGILDYLWVTIEICAPSYWLMTGGRYDAKWDHELQELMKVYRFTDYSTFTVTLGSHRLWYENHPYASFLCPDRRSCRPSRRTIYLANRKMKRDVASAPAAATTNLGLTNPRGITIDDYQLVVDERNRLIKELETAREVIKSYQNTLE